MGLSININRTIGISLPSFSNIQIQIEIGSDPFVNCNKSTHICGILTGIFNGDDFFHIIGICRRITGVYNGHKCLVLRKIFQTTSFVMLLFVLLDFNRTNSKGIGSTILRSKPCQRSAHDGDGQQHDNQHQGKYFFLGILLHWDSS